MSTDLQAYQERIVTFNPNEHLMQIPNKGGKTDYLPVQWRLVWFREQCPDGTIETEMVLLDLDRETEEEAYAWNNETRRSEKIMKRANGIAIFRATVRDGKGGFATGTKSEKAASFADFIEKAETGAIGRALAALGYGTQFAPELNEEQRIVDAPVERRQPQEQDKRAYEQRKPFVDGSVSVKEEQPPKKPLLNGDGTPVAFTVMGLFEKGRQAGLWERPTFYQKCSEILGKPVTHESVRTLSQKELAEIDTLIDAAIEEPVAATSGK